MGTSWAPFYEPGPRVTEDDVRRFEREFGHELPADYRAFLLEVNGGHAPRSHCVFTLRRRARQDESILRGLFSLNAPDDQDDLATAQKHYNPDVKLPEGFLEIGYDGSGCPVVLPLVGQHRGEVWYFDIEDDSEDRPADRVEWFDRRDVWKLADSFAEFMAGLRPLEDDASASTSL
jgi:cell wall assembly regulator SMI1